MYRPVADPAALPVERTEEPSRHRTPLPRGRHGLPRGFVTSNQRERMLDSMAEMASAKGYARVTVSDVTTHAGVSRRTFYDQFSDKEDCFLAAFDTIGDQLLRPARAAARDGERSWAMRVRLALGALLELLAAEPAFARVALVEVLCSGQVALERRDALLDRFAAVLAPGQGPAPRAVAEDRRLARAVIGGVYETLYQRVIAGEVERLPELLPDLLYCVLVPYLGHSAALDERAAALAS
jgi:AcrR family transcriptional regulator